MAVQRIQGIMNGDDPFTPPILPQQIASSGQSSTLPSGVNSCKNFCVTCKANSLIGCNYNF